MGFDASHAVEPLDWNFAPHVDAKGTVPEPTEQALRKFQAGMAKQLKDLGIDTVDVTDQRALVSAMSKLDEEQLEQVADGTVDALAELCGGSPSREQLTELPPRIRNAFTGWLTGLLFGTEENPTSPNPGIRRSPAAANGAAIAS